MSGARAVPPIARPLGVFVGGFRWSGSGAVSDWLAGRDGLAQHAGSEASFGEIRAINYGIRYLAQTAAGRARWGERLGRRALCPDPSLMSELLGRHLSLERGILAPLYFAFDAAVTMPARIRIIPRFKAYKPLLDSQLGRDFREDAEYKDAVASFARELRSYMRRAREGSAGSEPWATKEVRDAASALIGLFYARLARGSVVPIFDNAFSGLDPELFRLVSPGTFAKRVFILVRRDPRDQFADIARYSGSPFSRSASSFIRQYRRTQERASMFVDSSRGDASAFIRLVDFEGFVLDRGGLRSRLLDELESFWEGSIMKGSWKSGPFRPDESERNIGIWRRAGLDASMERIERELGDFLASEASAG